MKYILIFFLLIFGTVSQDVPSFNFENNSPVDFLVENNQIEFFIVDSDSIPADWINFELVTELVNRIDSERITAPVFSINASVDLKRKRRTTEGVEAIHIIESYREGKSYPLSLSSEKYGILINDIIYPNPTTINEIKMWYNEFKPD